MKQYHLPYQPSKYTFTRALRDPNTFATHRYLYLVPHKAQPTSPPRNSNSLIDLRSSCGSSATSGCHDAGLSISRRRSRSVHFHLVNNAALVLLVIILSLCTFSSPSRDRRKLVYQFTGKNESKFMLKKHDNNLDENLEFFGLEWKVRHQIPRCKEQFQQLGF